MYVKSNCDSPAMRAVLVLWLASVEGTGGSWRLFPYIPAGLYFFRELQTFVPGILYTPGSSGKFLAGGVLVA